MRAALHDDTGLVVNVLELPDDYDPEDPAAFQPPDGYSLVVLEPGSPVSPGWTITGDTVEPPEGSDPDPVDPGPTCASLALEVNELRTEVAELRALLEQPAPVDPVDPA